MNSKRHLLHFVLSAVMVLLLLCPAPISAKAETNTKGAGKVWSGEVDTSWYTGDKTSYDISTAEQLAGFSILVRDAAHEDRFRGVTINLTNDIILNDTSNFANWGTQAPKNNWDPIGKIGGPIKGYCPFAGVFNGNGHTITGMYCDTNEDGGLFCYTSGAIINDLKITQAYVVSTGTAGAVVGVSENSFFSGIEVNNSTIIAKKDRFAGAGGIVGTAEQKNNISTVSYAILLSMGIVVNPIIWFDPDVTKGETIYGTYILDSKVSDCKIRSEAKIYESCAGGFIGEAHQDVAIYNGTVKGCLFAAYTDFGRGAAGKYGAFVGTFEHSAIEADKIIKNCSYCACVRADRYDDGGINDATYVKNATSGWQKIFGKWYYFTKSGDLVTGWKQIDGKWYYFTPAGDNRGIMATGWQQISNKWYYLNGGAMTTGWKQISGKWYYFGSSGVMATGWKQIGGVWYYFKDGAMATGWQKISNKWYYFNGGAMTTGWKKLSGKWYYFDANGKMLASTSKTIGGKVYKFNSSGVCTNP